MGEAKKQKFLTKSIKFGVKTVTLYSLDGLTWSSKKQELVAIKERLENQRVTIGAVKGEDASDAPVKAKSAEKDDEPVVLSDDDDDAPAVRKGVVAEEDSDDDDEDIPDPLMEDDIDLVEEPVIVTSTRPLKEKAKAPKSKPAPKLRGKRPALKAAAKAGSKQRRKAA